MNTATLAQAAHDGDLTRVIACLAEGSNPSESDGIGWTPLLYGVLAGDPAIVNALIRAGADPNLAAPDGATPLIKAALWGHLEIVQALLIAGADPERRDRGGWSALDLAEAGHRTDAMHLLRAAGR